MLLQAARKRHETNKATKKPVSRKRKRADADEVEEEAADASDESDEIESIDDEEDGDGGIGENVKLFVFYSARSAHAVHHRAHDEEAATRDEGGADGGGGSMRVENASTPLLQIREGREGRGKFGRPKEKGSHVGRTNKQIAKKKNFGMLKPKVRGKNRQRSYQVGGFFGV